MPDETPPHALSPGATLVVVCHVCGEPLLAETATCNNCHRVFHLRTREDSDGRDCGRVWVNEQFLSLEFACDVCLGRGAEEPAVGHGH